MVEVCFASILGTTITEAEVTMTGGQQMASQAGQRLWAERYLEKRYRPGAKARPKGQKLAPRVKQVYTR